MSVPEGATEGPTAIVARATRPAGANLPTPAVVAATREMLGIVGGLCGDDLAIVVLSGGGSALMALPRDGVSLDEKIAITRRMSESGADIATLNAARRGLSAVKGGGMARACAAGRLLVLVLSDVVGDDLDVIASGPCMPGDASAPDGAWTTPRGCVVRHVLVGTGDTAVAAAAHAARDLGYLVRTRLAISGPETVAPAADVGRRLAAEALALAAESRRDGRPRALIEGGEATVALPADHGIGGRNQHTVVAALEAVLEAGAWPGGVLVASVGTDGEDGPTAAAGGVADAAVADAVVGGRLDVSAARRRCDAEPLLAAAGGLVTTGPTGTNVGDVRMILVRP